MTKKWNLWIDDVRDPSFFSQDWEEKQYVWATGVEQAIYFCRLWGPPAFMALDHDLGIDPLRGLKREVPEFLTWLQKEYPSDPPDYSCHTANPIGEQNMTSFMDSWKRSLNLG